MQFLISFTNVKMLVSFGRSNGFSCSHDGCNNVSVWRQRTQEVQTLSSREHLDFCNSFCDSFPAGLLPSSFDPAGKRRLRQLPEWSLYNLNQNLQFFSSEPPIGPPALRVRTDHGLRGCAPTGLCPLLLVSLLCTGLLALSQTGQA